MELRKIDSNAVRLQAAFMEQMIKYAMPQTCSSSGGEFDFIMHQTLAAELSRRLDLGLDPK
ncbi:MAG: hypothetical protein DI498_02515 [Paracoccus denitrificans]|nr:MAG: hypothetical protein DI498_02515 [Paracoccus denitrificans]PZO86016.1 MAG: hypothetical protein DI633_02515 [Paracoccus denitrificans]